MAMGMDLLEPEVLRRVITKRTTCYLRGMTLEDFNHMVDFEALVHDDHDGTVVHAPQHRDRSIVGNFEENVFNFYDVNQPSDSENEDQSNSANRKFTTHRAPERMDAFERGKQSFKVEPPGDSMLNPCSTAFTPRNRVFVPRSVLHRSKSTVPGDSQHTEIQDVNDSNDNNDNDDNDDEIKEVIAMGQLDQLITKAGAPRDLRLNPCSPVFTPRSSVLDHMIEPSLNPRSPIFSPQTPVLNHGVDPPLNPRSPIFTPQTPVHKHNLDSASFSRKPYLQKVNAIPIDEKEEEDEADEDEDEDNHRRYRGHRHQLNSRSEERFRSVSKTSKKNLTAISMPNSVNADDPLCTKAVKINGNGCDDGNMLKLRNGVPFYAKEDVDRMEKLARGHQKISPSVSVKGKKKRRHGRTKERDDSFESAKQVADSCFVTEDPKDRYTLNLFLQQLNFDPQFPLLCDGKDVDASY